MAAPKFYEGQEFHNPSDPSAPVLVYKAGKFLPKGEASAVAPKAPSPQDAAYLTGLREQSTKSLDTAQQAARFIGLNQKHGTGGLLSLPFMSDMASSLSEPYGTMESITSQVAPGLRPPGSGSSSDKDVKFYRRGFPNLDFPGQTNANISNRLHEQSDRDAAHAAFVDRWYQRTGTLLGSEPAFQSYWAKAATHYGGEDKKPAVKTQGDGWRIIP